MDKFEILYTKIMELAKTNDDIRVVEMNGSRVNPHIEADPYQDFDIVFYVKNYKSFINDDTWLNVFDKPLLCQTTKDQRDGTIDDSYIYMMQFTNGTRLDLSIVDVVKFTTRDKDSLSVILLDKDGYDPLDNPNESSYYVFPSTLKEFQYSVNEFYWLIPYVAKGIKRKHYFYAHKHLNLIRNELEHMIDWWIGQQYDFQISVGKGKSKYIQLLPKEYYKSYELTYCDLKENNIWSALYQAIDLYDLLANELSDIYDYSYNKQLKKEVINFLEENYQ